MPTRPRLSSSLGIYHVVYRGINKQRIFEDSEDYEKFLSILRKFFFIKKINNKMFIKILKIEGKTKKRKK